MSTATDYAQPRRIDWTRYTDAAVLVFVMLLAGGADSIADRIAGWVL